MCDDQVQCGIPDGTLEKKEDFRGKLANSE